MNDTLRFKIDTWLKQATVQGSSLPDNQRQLIEARTVLPVSEIRPEGNHLKITLGKDEQGNQISFKGRVRWFVYEPAVDVLRDGQVIDASTQDARTPVYSMRIDLSTWLKQSTAQSSTLPDSQKQLVRAGNSLPVASFTPVGPHLHITLGLAEDGTQVSFKGYDTWYVYRPAVELLKDGQPVDIPAPTLRGPTFALKILADTILKLSTAQSSALSEQQKQAVTAGTILPLASHEPAGQSHLKITLGLDERGKQVSFKGRRTWYAYEPVVEILRDEAPINFASPLAGKTIVLDPGHGEIDRAGNDPGAINQFLDRNERDEVRKQTDIIKDLLEGKGGNVKIIENNTGKTLNQIGLEGGGSDCFVSLHLNAFNREVQGHEVFLHSQGTANDERLATLVNQALAVNLDIPNRGVKRRRLAVLGGVPLPVPAILTEAFFIDSVTDAATLDDWNTRAANSIAQGIERFLTQ